MTSPTEGVNIVAASPTGSFGTMLLHGAGDMRSFVITEPHLDQMLSESEHARDAGAIFFCGAVRPFDGARIT